MKAPSYADPGQKAAFATWLEAERVRTGVSRNDLSAAIGAEGTNRVGQFLNGKRLPLPGTLRALCRAMGIPWFIAFANAGYYRQLLVLLEDLVALACTWCDEDDVYPPRDEGSFRSVGVLKVAGAMAAEAVENDARARSRYVIGSYSEADIGMTMRCVVPKPLAIALFVGTAGFPRRGDIYKNGRAAYAAEVLEAAEGIVALADGVDDTRKPMGLLRNADSALKSRTLPLDERRASAGEYITAWCDQQNQVYTHYARLAIYRRWGETGSSESTVSAYTVMPDIRLAECPNPETFRL